MNESIQQFEALSGPFSTLVLSALVLGIVLLIACFFLFKKPGTNAKLIAMLIGFGGMIALGTAFFGYISGGRGAPVELYADRIESPFGTMDRANILKIYFQENVARSPLAKVEMNRVPDFNSGREYLLIVQPKRGTKRLVFSSNDYPIQEMHPVLNEWMK